MPDNILYYGDNFDVLKRLFVAEVERADAPKESPTPSTETTPSLAQEKAVANHAAQV